MDRHFLYLPLYLAQFDDPKGGKAPWFGLVPPEYEVAVHVPAREQDRNDKAVFDLLMDARLRSSDLMFAACDPTVLLARPDRGARMAAGLIASSAFWAVNHDSRNVRVLSDLAAFDRILCYKAGTTSNLIARRIMRREKQKLVVVDSTDEIARLEHFGEGTVALSPEVLKIATLLHGPLGHGQKRAKIVLELSTSKEFSNVLTTVLFTRAEVVESHPALVSGVLAAIQAALLAIHSGDPIVRACAESAYRDAYCLDEALSIASSANVFPETIQVRRDRWQRAVEFYHVSQALAAGRDKDCLSRAEELEAEELYRSVVLDHGLQCVVSESLAQGCRVAVARDQANRAPAASGGKWFGRSVRLVSGVALGAGATLGAVGGPATVAVGFSTMAMVLSGGWLCELARYESRSMRLCHWISYGLMWWVVHELVVAPYVPGANLPGGGQLTDRTVGAILTLAGSWCIGAGLYSVSKSRP
jgi:hypothetical protein